MKKRIRVVQLRPEIGELAGAFCAFALVSRRRYPAKRFG
jgi:hypothetical protein